MMWRNNKEKKTDLKLYSLLNGHSGVTLCVELFLFSFSAEPCESKKESSYRWDQFLLLSLAHGHRWCQNGRGVCENLHSVCDSYPKVAWASHTLETVFPFIFFLSPRLWSHPHGALLVEDVRGSRLEKRKDRAAAAVFQESVIGLGSEVNKLRRHNKAAPPASCFFWSVKIFTRCLKKN